MPEGPGGRGFHPGLAIGQFWLTIIATVAASLARVWARTSAETVAILAIVIVVGLVLIVADAFFL
jgi:tryptophan-rich sensory protein